MLCPILSNHLQMHRLFGVDAHQTMMINISKGVFTRTLSEHLERCYQVLTGSKEINKYKMCANYDWQSQEYMNKLNAKF